MKVKSLLIGFCFVSLMSSTYSANAKNPDCYTIAIVCNGEPVTNLVTCGTYEKVIDEIVELEAAIC